MNGEVNSNEKRADSLSELFSFADREFVRRAYLTLLGRTPDVDGEQRFTGQLRAGLSRTQILLALGSSQEARQSPVELPGLRRRLILARLFKLPGLRRLANLGTGEYSNSRRAKAKRRLENEVARLHKEGELNAVFVTRLTEKVERLNARVILLESAEKMDAAARDQLVTVEQILAKAE